jgi:hypothetical protein
MRFQPSPGANRARSSSTCGCWMRPTWINRKRLGSLG